MGAALVQITTSVPSLAAQKKENVVQKERGPLAKQHKNDVGYYFPNTILIIGVELKAKIVTYIFIKAIPFKLTTAMPNMFQLQNKEQVLRQIRKPNEM